MLVSSYKQHFKLNVKLAIPVLLGQIGHTVTGLADSIMVGGIGKDPLAACAFSTNLFMLFLIFPIGYAMGITPIIGKLNGEGSIKKMRSVFWNGHLALLIQTVILLLLLGITSLFLDQMGQEPQLIGMSRNFFFLLSFSIIPFGLFLSAKHFLEGIEETKIPMKVSIVGNLLNVVLNYLLIYGKLGLPELGLLGAGVATLIARIFMAFYIFYCIYKHHKLRSFLKFDTYTWTEIINRQKEIFKVGMPIAMQTSFEVAAFALGGIMTGWVSAAALAAHQIAINVASICYMAATGIASAAAIRVSNQLGKGNFMEMRKAGMSNFMLVLGFMSCTASIMYFGRFYIPTFYVENQEVIQIASTLFVIGALFQLFDGIQVVALGSLRGMKDVKTPSIIALFSYWVISLPISYYFAIYLQVGAFGVWLGFLAGLFFAALLLFLRFIQVSNKFVVKNYSNE